MVPLRWIVGVACATLAVTTSAMAQDAPPAGGSPGARMFQFSPEKGPLAEGFTRVSASSTYNKEAGFGWLDLKGKTSTGAWLEKNHWEACENLNVVERPGPDDLGRTYASGPATFALDLPAGRYDVWGLSGDWGLLEYVPHEPYSITVQGREAYRFSVTPEAFYKAFDDWGRDDLLTAAEAYDRHVAPRFAWSKATVDVRDGPLKVSVSGPERDKGIVKIVGNYAITEGYFGPSPRFAGALNAILVAPAGKSADAQAKVEAWRKENFAARYPLEAAATAPAETPITDADKARGYRLFFPLLTDPARPETVAPSSLGPIALRVTPGEQATATLAISAVGDLGRVQLSASPLTGPEGAVIAPANVRIGVVRYAAASAKKPRAWKPAPLTILPEQAADVKPGRTKQWWISVDAPENARPGTYEGALTLTPAAAAPTVVKVTLEVLPFKIERPKDLAAGVTYFVPAQDAFFGEERFWKRVKAEFADMRRHHMTTVQLTGMGIDNPDTMTKLLDAYREAGFEQPVDLLEVYSAIYLGERRLGLKRGTPEYFAQYKEAFEKLVDESKKRHWPPVIYDFGDEFTNSASEEFGADLAKLLRTIPGIVTCTDSNGWKEVSLMAPHVNIVAFNVGWNGPKNVNKGKQLLSAATVDLIKKSGATPWFVNVGKDRLSNGCYLWKMYRLGVRGKIEWIYRAYNGYPNDFFDAGGPSKPLASPGPDFAPSPSLEWEWMRIGLDDLAYLVTLENALAAARPDAAKAAVVSEADDFLKKLDGSIRDDCWKVPGTMGEGEQAATPWPPERMDTVRNQAIDLLLKLKAK